MAGKFSVRFTLPGGGTATATGREAQALEALVNAGTRGITSLDTFKAGWAVRLAAYILDLKKMGVPIRAEREKHDGGSHARYFLAGPVAITWRSDEQQAEAA